MRLAGLTYDSPNTFTFKQRLILATAPRMAAWTLRGLCLASKVERRTRGLLDNPKEKRDPFIAAFWHETCALAACCFAYMECHTLTSYSFDGELAARVVRHCGFDAVRGSSSRGGTLALGELEKALRHVRCVGLTVDGPRGPRRVPKPGAAILSAKTRVPIIPVAFCATRCWRLNSWDRFMIPKPFGRIICKAGPIIPAPADATRASIKATQESLGRILNELQAAVDSECGYDRDN